MKNIILSFLFLFTIASQIKAQNRDYMSQVSQVNFLAVEQNLFKRTDFELRGHPYWHNKWIPASIDVGAVTMDSVPTKFLVYGNQQIMALKPEGDSIFIPFQLVREVRFYPSDGEVLRLVRQAHADNKAGELFYTPHDGRYKLLIKPSCTLSLGSAENGYSGRNYDEFIPNTETFIALPGNEKLQKIKRNEKSLFKVLPEHEKEIRTYIKDNKLDLDKDLDLASVIEYYEKLEQQ